MHLPAAPKKPGGMISVMLNIQIPDKKTTTESVEKQKIQPTKLKKSVEDTVNELLECIDSDYASHVEWLTIRKLYSQLRSLKKPSERALNVMRKIEPVLNKYGYSSSVDTETIKK